MLFNVCISQVALFRSKVITLGQELNEMCEFDEELSDINARLEAEMNAMKLKLNETEAKLNETFEALQAKSNEISAKSHQIMEFKSQAATRELQIASQQQVIGELKMELVSAKSEVKEQKLQCKQQLSTDRELLEELKLQWNFFRSTQTLDIPNNLQFKVRQKETDIIGKTQEN